MDKRRGSREYFKGVNRFVEFASPSTRDGKILCPCVKCVNLLAQPLNVAREHFEDSKCLFVYLDNIYLEDGQCVLGYVAVLGQCVLGRWTMFICVNMLLYCTLFIIFELP